MARGIGENDVARIEAVREAMPLESTLFRRAPVTERRYDEEEVAIILQRAAESRVGSAEGLTLAQLKEIAADVGIDPAAVEAAAGSLDRRVAAPPSPLLGTPSAPQYEQTVPVPFDRVDQSELVLAIRRTMERHGVLDAGPNGLEWRARDATGGRYVTVLARGQETLVRVLGNFRDGAGVWLMAGGMMIGMVALVLLKSLGLLVPGPAKGLGLLLSAVTGFLGGRQLWRWRYRREQQRLSDTVEAVAAVLRSSGAPDGALAEGSSSSRSRSTAPPEDPEKS